MKDYIIIGFGHRARQGKDTLAQYVKDMRTNTHILHFADALYEEVRNIERKWPLVERCSVKNDRWDYFLLTDSYRGLYKLFTEDEVPYLHSIFQERKIDIYWGMDEKDAPMLQFWGTNFRRKENQNYWVDRLDDKMRQITLYSSSPTYVCIPDVRFLNEVYYIEYLSDDIANNKCSKYIKVVRLNEDWTQYIDPSRDPNHPSEVELEGHKSFMTLTAKSGDLNRLAEQTVEMLNIIEGTCQ